jgi:hypothetical protein
MGDSQIQRLRCDIISPNSYNIASSGEHYFFTYQKLKKILQNKENRVKQILLGISIHSFAPAYNRLFSLQFPDGKSSLKRYLYFLEITDSIEFLADLNKHFDSKFISYLYANPEWGGYFESTNSKPDPSIIDKTLRIHYSLKQDEDKFCFSQIKYLSAIDSLCQTCNIDLVLLSTPYHPDYRKKIKPEYINFFNEIKQKFRHRTHINYSEVDINPNMVSDANHLNKLGAKYYSETIAADLDKTR